MRTICLVCILILSIVGTAFTEDVDYNAKILESRSRRTAGVVFLLIGMCGTGAGIGTTVAFAINPQEHGIYAGGTSTTQVYINPGYFVLIGGLAFLVPGIVMTAKYSRRIRVYQQRVRSDNQENAVQNNRIVPIVNVNPVSGDFSMGFTLSY